mgnify:CR=1 FL=1
MQATQSRIEIASLLAMTGILSKHYDVYVDGLAMTFILLAGLLNI